MLNARLFGFWNDLGEALKTGKPQNELKLGGKSMFEEVYADPARLCEFLRAMSGLRSKSASDTADLAEVSARLGHTSTAVTKRHYVRKPALVKPLR